MKKTIKGLPIPKILGLFAIAALMLTLGCKDAKEEGVDPDGSTVVRTGLDKTLFDKGFYGTAEGFDRGVRDLIVSRFPDNAYPNSMKVELTFVNNEGGPAIFANDAAVRKDSILLAMYKANATAVETTPGYFPAVIAESDQKFFPNTKGRGIRFMEDPWGVAIAKPMPGKEVTGLILGNIGNNTVTPIARIYGE